MAKKVKDKVLVDGTDTPVDTRTQKERRADRKALRDRALEEALASDTPFDETIPAIKFEQDYAAAYKEATTSPKAISAADILAARKKVQEAMAPKTEVVETAPVQTEAVAEQVEPELTPTQKTAAAAKAALTGTAAKADEAIKRFEERNPPVEEIEPIPAEHADPAQTEAVAEPEPKADDPLYDEKGVLVRMPGESSNKYNKRKQAMLREAKKIAARVVVTEETRNGEPPTEEVTAKSYPTGELDYHSDHDGQSLTPPAKSAEESAAVFGGSEPGLQPGETKETDETSTEETPATDTPAEPTTEQPVEQTEAPAEVQTTAVEHSVEENTTVAQPPVERPKLVSDNTNKPKTPRSAETIAAAKKFYGSTWNDERAEKLTDAYYWLMKAIEAQTAPLAGNIPPEKRVELMMNTALRNENEALNIGKSIAKAA